MHHFIFWLTPLAAFIIIFISIRLLKKSEKAVFSSEDKNLIKQATWTRLFWRMIPLGVLIFAPHFLKSLKQYGLQIHRQSGLWIYLVLILASVGIADFMIYKKYQSVGVSDGYLKKMKRNQRILLGAIIVIPVVVVLITIIPVLLKGLLTH